MDCRITDTRPNYSKEPFEFVSSNVSKNFLNVEEVHYLPASRLIELMKCGKYSAVDVMKAHLDRIEKLNPILNGLVQQLSREECLNQSYCADQKRLDGSSLGKLHGLPITIKDTHLVKGLISCMGCIGLKDKVAIEDSTTVARLRKEGAIIIGLTNVPEFLSAYETDNDVYGRTNNPYDLTKTPGGSSGGCAALVSSGCIPLSIGSDAAGSLRWPAHCTGIATHKPTIGAIPRTGSPLGNAKGLSAQFATSGPMARSVEDLILTLQIISGSDGLDPHCPPVKLKNPKNVDIRQLRVAYFTADGISTTSNEIIDVVEKVAKALQDQVAKVNMVSLECLKESYRLLWEGFFLGGDKGEGTKGLLNRFGVDAPSTLLGEFLVEAEKHSLTTPQYRNLFREIDQFKISLIESLADYDVLISPVAATTAKNHGTCLAESKDMTHCMVHSLSGWPVTVIRCGVSSSGMPIGIQIAAKPWNDHICLALASKVESHFGGWQPSSISL